MTGSVTCFSSVTLTPATRWVVRVQVETANALDPPPIDRGANDDAVPTARHHWAILLETEWRIIPPLDQPLSPVFPVKITRETNIAQLADDPDKDRLD